VPFALGGAVSWLSCTWGGVSEVGFCSEPVNVAELELFA